MTLFTLVTTLVDPTPKPEDVKAGWLAFGLFLLLIAAVVVLSFSLVKQLRKAQAAKDAGVYDAPATPADQGPAKPAEMPADAHADKHPGEQGELPPG